MPGQQSSAEKLKGFFLELVHKSFGQLGVGDQQIADYIATVLSEFSRSDRWLQMRGADGRREDASCVKQSAMATRTRVSAPSSSRARP